MLPAEFFKTLSAMKSIADELCEIVHCDSKDHCWMSNIKDDKERRKYHKEHKALKLFFEKRHGKDFFSKQEFWEEWFNKRMRGDKK